MADVSRASLAVSTVIFALRPSARASVRPHELPHPVLWVPLVRRLREPFADLPALPGGPLLAGEDLVDAAGRSLHATTGLSPRYLEQLYAFGDADRSFGKDGARASAADARVVSIVYWALVGNDEASQAMLGDNVRWHRADDLPPLAFDHRLIIDYALWRLRTKVEYSSIAHSFLGDTFTLAQLREVYEAVLGRALDTANFRRQMLASGSLVETGETLAGTRHRPPKLYRYDTAVDPDDRNPLANRKAAGHDADSIRAQEDHADPARHDEGLELRARARHVPVGVRSATAVLRSWGVDGGPDSGGRT